MPKLINWALIGNPVNWVIVFSMALIGLVAIHFILEYQTS